MTGGQRRTRALADVYLNAFERIVRHRRSAGGAVAQRTDGHTRFEITAVFAVERRSLLAGLQANGKAYQGHRHPPGAAHGGVTAPGRFEAAAGESLVFDVLRRESL